MELWLGYLLRSMASVIFDIFYKPQYTKFKTYIREFRHTHMCVYMHRESEMMISRR